MLLIHILVFCGGIALILLALFSAIRTFLVPRSVADRLTREIFVSMRFIFGLLTWFDYRRDNDRMLAYYAPITLLTLPVVWLAFLLGGYTALYWSLGAHSWNQAFALSRLSLFALASDLQGLPSGVVFAFSETALSVLLAAILVAYLPTLYSAFSVREAAVTGLETRAGSPATPLKMLIRFHKIDGMDQIGDIWKTWQEWFEMVEETHVALQTLVHYRSPQRGRSWITAAGAVLDTASIAASSLDGPREPGAELCIRAGYLCLQRIADSFGLPYPVDPSPLDPISVTRSEFEGVYQQLQQANVPLKPHMDQCWRDFSGWRVNYDVPLVSLCVLVSAPLAPWSSDRVLADRRVYFRAHRLAKEVAIDLQSFASARPDDIVPLGPGSFGRSDIGGPDDGR
jgi:hypothetical protein